MSSPSPYQQILDDARRGVQPLTMHWELTWRCNLSCRHCYLPKTGPGAECTADEAQRILARLEELGTLYLILSGGEPLLRDDFGAIVESAQRRGFAMRLLSNGTLLDAAMADRLAAATILSVEISMLGGDGETHDALTGVAGSFDKAWRAVELLRDRGLPVTLKCPVMGPNHRGFRNLRNRAEERGCRLLFDTTIAPGLDGNAGPLELAMGEDELEAFLGEQGDVLPTPQAPPPEGIPCGAGQNAFALSPEGLVLPCVAVRRPLGHLLDDGWERIREHPFLERWRRIRIRDLPACHACDLLPWCARCPGLAMQETGDPQAPSSSACRVAQALARQAGASGLRPACAPDLRADGDPDLRADGDPKIRDDEDGSSS